MKFCKGCSLSAFIENGEEEFLRSTLLILWIKGTQALIIFPGVIIIHWVFPWVDLNGSGGGVTND